jgi:hypothetical protein
MEGIQVALGVSLAEDTAGAELHAEAELAARGC